MEYLLIDNSLSTKNFIDECEIAVKYQFSSVTVLPSFIKIAKSSVKNSVLVDALISYPYGEDSFIVKEKLKLALEAIPTLKKQYRELIQSRIEGLSYKDIAEKLAIDELTVKSNLNKARNVLKQKISYH